MATNDQIQLFSSLQLHRLCPHPGGSGRRRPDCPSRDAVEITEELPEEEDATLIRVPSEANSHLLEDGEGWSICVAGSFLYKNIVVDS